MYVRQSDNSILYGNSSSNLNKLQRVQNALARTAMMTKKRDHITPVLARLHWLPVTACIQLTRSSAIAE